MNSVHFSTGKDDWGTPQDLFDALNEEFNFTLDPCADNNNHKCAKYYTIENVTKRQPRGDRRGYAYTRPNRYDHVSRLHFRKSRNTIYQRAC